MELFKARCTENNFEERCKKGEVSFDEFFGWSIDVFKEFGVIDDREFLLLNIGRDMCNTSKQIEMIRQKQEYGARQ